MHSVLQVINRLNALRYTSRCLGNLSDRMDTHFGTHIDRAGHRQVSGPSTQRLQNLTVPSFVQLGCIIDVIIFPLNLLHLPIIIPPFIHHVNASTPRRSCTRPFAPKVTLCLKILILNHAVIALRSINRIRSSAISLKIAKLPPLRLWIRVITIELNISILLYLFNPLLTIYGREGNICLLVS